MTGTIGDLGTLVTPVVAAPERQGLTGGRASPVRRPRFGVHGRDLGSGHRPPRAGGDAGRDQRRASRRGGGRDVRCRGTRRGRALRPVRYRRRRGRHPRADPPAAGRSGGPGRQARPGREADDEHPGRRGCHGRRRRCGERPSRDLLAASLSRGADGGQGRDRGWPDRPDPDDPHLRAERRLGHPGRPLELAARPGLALHGLGRARLRHHPLADRGRGDPRLRPVRELHGHPAAKTRARWRPTRSTTGCWSRSG